MPWSIAKVQNNKTYYLKRIAATGRAIWTSSESTALEYKNLKAAEYVINYARLQNVRIVYRKTPPTSQSGNVLTSTV